MIWYNLNFLIFVFWKDLVCQTGKMPRSLSSEFINASLKHLAIVLFSWIKSQTVHKIYYFSKFVFTLNPLQTLHNLGNLLNCPLRSSHHCLLPATLWFTVKNLNCRNKNMKEMRWPTFSATFSVTKPFWNSFFTAVYNDI